MMLLRSLIGLLIITGVTYTTAHAQDATEPPTAPGPGVEYVVEDGVLFAVQGETRNKVELPHQVVAIYITQKTLYAAHGKHGATTLSLEIPWPPK